MKKHERVIVGGGIGIKFTKNLEIRSSIEEKPDEWNCGVWENSN